ncbi:MAG: MFS transporter [Firmicutes bacterium]|nr:MFS transporter [Bacillota bacterium]
MEDIFTKQKKTLAIILVTSFITTFMGSAINLSIPKIETDFNASAAQVSWVITSYMLTSAALCVPFGKISDTISLKKVECAGLAVFSIGTFMGCVAGSILFLLLSRVVQGIGAAIVFSSNLPIGISIVEESQKSKLIGYVTASNYLGLSLGPVVGGILNNNFGWKSIFVVTAIITVFTFCGAIKVLPKVKNNTDEKLKGILPLKETILYIVSICILMYGLSSISVSGVSWLYIIIGIISFIAFVILTLKADKPLIDLRNIQKNRPYVFANIAAMLNYGVIFVTSYLLSLYLQYIKGYSSQKAGFILVLAPIFQAVLSPFAGKLLKKYTPQKISSIGVLMCGSICGLLCFIKKGTSIHYLAFLLIIEGIACALFSAPNTAEVFRLSKDNNYGVTSSILSTMRSVGHSLIMAIVAMVTGIFIGTATLAGQPVSIIVKIIKFCFYITTGLAIVGFFMVKKYKA